MYLLSDNVKWSVDGYNIIDVAAGEHETLDPRFVQIFMHDHRPPLITEIQDHQTGRDIFEKQLAASSYETKIIVPETETKPVRTKRKYKTKS